MTAPTSLDALLAEQRADPESVGIDLRLDFAQALLAEMERRGWTQKDLAEAVGVKQSYVSRVVHSEANCTLGVIGRFFHALGARPRLIVERPRPSGTRAGGVLRSARMPMEHLPYRPGATSEPIVLSTRPDTGPSEEEFTASVAADPGGPRWRAAATTADDQ